MIADTPRLYAAVFTPFHADGSLNLDAVPALVEQLAKDGVDGIYICGSTGEGPSLTSEERKATAAAYVAAARGKLHTLVQVGHDSLAEAKALARHAQEIGAEGISAVPPWYFGCASLEVLLDCLAELTSAVAELPFYYYHIPARTRVTIDMPTLCERAMERLPNFAGIKYSSTAIDAFQACTTLLAGRHQAYFGCDEMLLSGLLAGATGAVGSTYNFAAPLYRRLIAALKAGDLDQAHSLQERSVAMVRVLERYGGPPAIKAMMALIGHDCGPSRLPQAALSAAQLGALRQEMEALGFFDWGR